MKVRRWIVLSAILAIILFVYSRSAEAEYYFVPGGASATVYDLHYSAPCRHYRTHYRTHYKKPRHAYYNCYCHHPRHHYRRYYYHRPCNHYAVYAYPYPNNTSCGNCGSGSFNPLETIEAVPDSGYGSDYYYGYGGEPVRYQTHPVRYYPAYYDYYENYYYDPDLATGDDDQVRHPEMEIN